MARPAASRRAWRVPDRYGCVLRAQALSGFRRSTALRFEHELHSTLRSLWTPCAGWCVLPNHYHILEKSWMFASFRRGWKAARQDVVEMNREDNQRGRKVWYRCEDSRCMRSDAHFYATLNYIHHNPIKHGFVKQWQDWAFSSVHWYFEEKGRELAAQQLAWLPVAGVRPGWD